MATHSSVLAWRIPGMEEPGGLLSMGSYRVRHDWGDLAAAAAACGSDGKESACNAADLDSIPGSGRSPKEGNGSPLQYSCLENPIDRGAWQGTVHGVTKSQTWLSCWHTHIHTHTHTHTHTHILSSLYDIERTRRRSQAYLQVGKEIRKAFLQKKPLEMILERIDPHACLILLFWWFGDILYLKHLAQCLQSTNVSLV